jgi:hypothetical protein
VSDVNYFIPVAPPAMGIAKKHLYRDCQHIKRAAVHTVPSTNKVHTCLPLCKACENRQTKERGT